MSNSWINVRNDIMRRPEIAVLSPRQFRREFERAAAGQPSVFYAYVRGPYVRPVGDEWVALRSAAFERDDFTCQYCGQRGGRLECDHVVPVSRGGSSDLSNLATACFRCNRSKRNKTLEEWLQ